MYGVSRWGFPNHVLIHDFGAQREVWPGEINLELHVSGNETLSWL